MKKLLLSIILSTLLFPFTLQGSDTTGGGGGGASASTNQLTCGICEDEKDASKFYEDFCTNEHSEKICTKCLRSLIRHNISCPYCRGALTEGAMQASQENSHLENLMIMIERGDLKTKYSAIIALEKSIREEKNLHEFEDLHLDFIGIGIVPALVNFIEEKGYYSQTIQIENELIAYHLITLLASYSNEAKLAISSQGATDLLIKRSTKIFFNPEGKTINERAREILQRLVIGEKDYKISLVPHYVKELYITPIQEAIEEGCLALAELSKNNVACQEIRNLECQKRLLQLAECDSILLRENATAVLARILLLT